MGKINWGRVLLCGLLAGVVWFVLGGLIYALVGKDFAAAVQAVGGGVPPTSAGSLVFLVILNFAIGFWTMWLYAAIRPRYGPGPKTAAVAGLALWVFGSLTDAIWGSFGVIPLGVLLTPVVATLPVIILATMVGAWLYKE